MSLAPLLGWLAERLVFRPLRQREASSAETLVASLGVLVLLIGIAYEIWGLQSHLDAPSIVPSGSVDLPGGATIDRISLAQLAVAILVVLALTLLTRLTRVGRVVRAVVDNRDLARGNGIRADHVAAGGWMVRLRTRGPDRSACSRRPSHTVLDSSDTSSSWSPRGRRGGPAVLADGVVAAALALGSDRPSSSQVQLSGRLQNLIGSLHANLFVVALLLGLLLVPRLAETGRRPFWASSAARPAGDPAPSRPACCWRARSSWRAGQRHTAEEVPGLALVSSPSFCSAAWPVRSHSVPPGTPVSVRYSAPRSRIRRTALRVYRARSPF